MLQNDGNENRNRLRQPKCIGREREREGGGGGKTAMPQTIGRPELSRFESERVICNVVVLRL